MPIGCGTYLDLLLPSIISIIQRNGCTFSYGGGYIPTCVYYGSSIELNIEWLRKCMIADRYDYITQYINNVCHVIEYKEESKWDF